MKKIIVTLITLITIAATIVFIGNSKTNNKYEAETFQYLETIQTKIDTENIDYLFDDFYNKELRSFKNIEIENIAVLVSNKDFKPGFIQAVAQYNGYKYNYQDLCLELIDQGLLVYIPEYKHPKHGVLNENIVTPYTVGYELAVEAGVIK